MRKGLLALSLAGCAILAAAAWVRCREGEELDTTGIVFGIVQVESDGGRATVLGDGGAVPVP